MEVDSKVNTINISTAMRIVSNNGLVLLPVSWILLSASLSRAPSIMTSVTFGFGFDEIVSAELDSEASTGILLVVATENFDPAAISSTLGEPDGNPFRIATRK